MVHTLPKRALSGGKTLEDMGGMITAQLLRDTFSFEAYAMGAYGNNPVVFLDSHPVGYSIGKTAKKDPAIQEISDRWARMKKQNPALDALEADDMHARHEKDRRNAKAKQKRQMLSIYRTHIQRGGLIGIGKPGFTLN